MLAQINVQDEWRTCPDFFCEIKLYIYLLLECLYRYKCNVF